MINIKNTLLTLMCVGWAIVAGAQPVVPDSVQDELVTDCVIDTAYVGGCQEGYACFAEGADRACARGEDCSAIPFTPAGDNKCHKVCASDADCLAGFTCLEKEVWHGDYSEHFKLCLAE